MKQPFAHAALVIVVVRAALTMACGGSGPTTETPSDEAGASAVDGGALESGAPDGAAIAQEPLCNAEGFCWENPFPHAIYALDLAATGPNDVWVVGYPGELLHYDGARWTKTNLPTFAALTAVWASAPNDVWVGGYEYSDEGRTLLFHFDGAAWTLRYSAGTDAGANALRGLRDLWGAGPHDVWAVGNGGGILHFDGTSWTPQASATTTRLVQVSGSSATDVWTLPPQHFDGAAWHSVDTAHDGAHQAMWVAAPNDVWIALERSAGDDAGGGTPTMSMLHFDGAGWTEHSRPGTSSIFGMWGSGPNDVWATGTGAGVGGEVGSVLHFDGQSWKTAPFDDVPVSSIVGGSSATDVWFYDRKTTSLFHYDGAHVSRSPQQAVTHALFWSVWGLAADDTWAVGGEQNAARIAHRTAHGWEMVDAGTGGALHDVRGSSADNVWAVGDHGTVLRFDGKTWSAVSAGVDGRLQKVWTSGPDDVWVTGDDAADGGTHAITLHYDGKTWTVAAPPNVSSIANIAGSARDDVWLDGWGTSGRAVLHFDGVSWSPIANMPFGDFGVEAIAVAARNDVWIGTAHFDGAQWTRVPADPQVAVVSIWPRAPNDVWTMSAMGEIAHYDGTRFRHISTTGNSAAMTGAGGDLFVVGMYGQIIHKAL